MNEYVCMKCKTTHRSKALAPIHWKYRRIGKPLLIATKRDLKKLKTKSGYRCPCCNRYYKDLIVYNSIDDFEGTFYMPTCKYCTSHCTDKRCEIQWKAILKKELRE